MRVQVLSDLHFEFHADGGKAFVESLDPAGVDVLVVAGDLTTATGLDLAVELLCSRYRKVIYVVGNHEYYHSDILAVHRKLGKLVERHEEFLWLHNTCATVEGKSFATVDGVTFAGTPLWFRDQPWNAQYAQYLSDFHVITGFSDWVYEENAKSLQFLESLRKVRPQVVVTHHLPSPQSVLPEFRNSPLNRFFLCDVTELMQELKPVLWVHGHTHGSVDYELGHTRVVCNPFGYIGHQTNRSYRTKWTVDV